MKNNFHRWGGGRASIAGEPFFPGEPPMSTLCTGFERWGRRLRVNERLRGPKGDQHSLRSQKLDECPSDLATRPIAPAHRLNRNRRRGSWKGWCLFSDRRRSLSLGDRCSTFWRYGSRRSGARPEDGAHTTGFLGGAGFLTLFAQRARATMANAGGIQYAQRAVTFWSAFLHKERVASWTPERPIGLRDKRGPRKTMGKGRLCPLGRSVGRLPIQRVLRGLGFACRGVMDGSGFGRGRRCPIRRRIIIGRRRRRLLHLRIGQIRHAHRCRLCVLSQLQVYDFHTS
jgi:hypothetical protein